MAVGQMDYLTGILRRLVFRITELLEAEPTEGETERAPSSEWAFDHVANYHGLGACRVYLSADFDLVDLSSLNIPFDTKDFDVADDFDLVANEYVCPKAGRYLVTVNLRLSVGGTFGLGLQIRKNGVTKIIFLDEWTTGIYQKSVTASIVLNCALADTINIRCTSQSVPAGTDNKIDRNAGYTNLSITGLAQ